MIQKNNKKGSFQVSLSVIVGIVFAVIILGLSISWITGSFSNITKISDKALASAEGSLQQGVVDKSLLLFSTDKIRIDKAVQGAVVMRNKFYEAKCFKVVIESPELDRNPLFDVVDKVGILPPIPADEIKEYKFSIQGNKELLKSYLDERKERAVRFQYIIYYANVNGNGQCPEEDYDHWEYYDNGNTIITVMEEA